MKSNYDVVIVGASSAGAYFAREMAKQGFSVLVIEKDSMKETSMDYDIFHITVEDIEAHNLPRPLEGDPVWSFEFADGAHYSPDYDSPKKFHVPTVGMHKHGYIMLIAKQAKDAGAEFVYDAPFVSVQTNGTRVTGITFKQGKKLVSVNAKIVVDASGQGAVVRTSLPDRIGVENFKLTNKDVFFVTLRYIKYKEPPKERWLTNHSWLWYKMWLAPSNIEYDGILGIGSCLSYEFGDKVYEKFLEEVSDKLPPYEVAKIEKKPTPYRHSLYSYVGDGFIAIGDAGIVNKPDNGEGVAVAMNHMDIAAEVIGNVLREGLVPTRENMWSINKRYNKVQGAEFAGTLALLARMLYCSRETIQYMFEKDCVMSKTILADLGKTVDLPDILHQGKELIFGLINGNIPWNEIKVVGAGAIKAVGIIVLYNLYPSTPLLFEPWRKLADKLWNSIGQMSDLYSE